MELEGTIFKDGRVWLIEIPSLNLMTQGKTKKEALEMIVDAAIGLAECYFASEIEKGFSITATEYGKGVVGLTSSNNKILLALSLKRQREKSGSTVREAAARLGSSSPNAYAQYEKGKTRISLEKYDQLLKAADPHRRSLLRVV
ncbi:MAG: hypothetical protein KR126chlam3_00814 [Chlamydiae bacterium]|nr:hypothetical protein [Chlamydiota bacterium]